MLNNKHSGVLRMIMTRPIQVLNGQIKILLQSKHWCVPKISICLYIDVCVWCAHMGTMTKTKWSWLRSPDNDNHESQSLLVVISCANVLALNLFLQLFQNCEKGACLWLIRLFLQKIWIYIVGSRRSLHSDAGYDQFSNCCNPHTYFLASCFVIFVADIVISLSVGFQEE